MTLGFVGKVMGIDPGDRRIGVALCDSTGTIAKPEKVILHESRMKDASVICQLAKEQDVGLIIVGAAYGSEGEETPASRKAARLADAIREATDLKVILWDESGSTQRAKEIRLLSGAGRKKRQGHQDQIAAAIILQDFLDQIRINDIFT